jgi:hypothetical protein
MSQRTEFVRVFYFLADGEPFGTVHRFLSREDCERAAAGRTWEGRPAVVRSAPYPKSLAWRLVLAAAAAPIPLDEARIRQTVERAKLLAPHVGGPMSDRQILALLCLAAKHFYRPERGSMERFVVQLTARLVVRRVMWLSRNRGLLVYYLCGLSIRLEWPVEQLQLLRVGLPARLEAQGIGSPTGKNLRQRLDGDLWRYNIDRHELLALLDLAERADVAEIVMGHAMRALAATAPGAAEALARRFGVPLPPSADEPEPPSKGNATE